MDSTELNTWHLYEALVKGDVSGAQKAVENGADPNANFSGETSLHWAVRNGHSSFVRVLLEHSCAPSPRTRFYQQTPLHCAADRGLTSIAKMLIEGGAELNARDYRGWTPLHVAVDQNYGEIVGLLLEKGSDINVRSNNGNSVLHFVRDTDLELYRFLLQKVEDKDPRDEHDSTPIMYAAAHGRQDIVQILMDFGASTKSVDDYGNSPADIARSEGHESLANFIEHPPKSFIDEESRELHNELLKTAFDLLRPYFEFGKKKSIDSDKDTRAVSRAVEILVRVVETNPYNWSAYWLLGLAHRSLGSREMEYDALKRAYTLERGTIDVGRELGNACIALGKGEEAVRITIDVLFLKPNDHGLIANHGLALLIAGQLEAAESAVSRSLELNPTDRITINLRNLILTIREGRLPIPSKWPPSNS